MIRMLMIKSRCLLLSCLAPSDELVKGSNCVMASVVVKHLASRHNSLTELSIGKRLMAMIILFSSCSLSGRGVCVGAGVRRRAIR